jgi:cytokinin riboside 5'-monophosphate phosphoribohydrolase
MDICVFCSSSNAVDDIYFGMAQNLGFLMASENWNLIYGGANVGLMDCLAQEVKKNGGKITGIIPEKIHAKGLSSGVCDELVICKTMGERKMLMHERSDAFVVLPGGFGTLEEMLEVITLKQLDYHRKPIVVINTNHFYDDLMNLFEKLYSEQFAKDNYRNLFAIVDSPLEAINYIKNYTHSDLGAKWFNVPNRDNI